jgi:hypothetical protein
MLLNIINVFSFFDTFEKLFTCKEIYVNKLINTII